MATWHPTSNVQSRKESGSDVANTSMRPAAVTTACKQEGEEGGEGWEAHQGVAGPRAMRKQDSESAAFNAATVSEGDGAVSGIGQQG